ncbi:hypothetical protein [Natranaeroarchaeum aerophilus]|uniref:Uncharacterized protein n=1 Tax=Natranaeroarchaeum aerophilus TaxID=2917711 RepID=A0AAE3FQ94_9EURY|nr:hypothetical protein [Natranaeroarchaeum aerophilus]MCL9812883.1 hypothetical protein [Natranaeroarchaeum aerophilus]
MWLLTRVRRRLSSPHGADPASRSASAERSFEMETDDFVVIPVREECDDR